MCDLGMTGRGRMVYFSEFEIYRKFYGKIAFMGGLSIQKTMPFGSEPEVIKESILLINELGKHGGYIFSPSHALTPDIPVKNVEAMLKVAGNQEKYLNDGQGYFN